MKPLHKVLTFHHPSEKPFQNNTCEKTDLYLSVLPLSLIVMRLVSHETLEDLRKPWLPCLRIPFTTHLLGFRRNILRFLERSNWKVELLRAGLVCCSVIMSNTFIQASHLKSTSMQLLLNAMKVLGNITHCKDSINTLLVYFRGGRLCGSHESCS